MTAKTKAESAYDIMLHWDKELTKAIQEGKDETHIKDLQRFLTNAREQWKRHDPATDETITERGIEKMNDFIKAAVEYYFSDQLIDDLAELIESACVTKIQLRTRFLILEKVAAHRMQIILSGSLQENSKAEVIAAVTEWATTGSGL